MSAMTGRNVLVAALVSLTLTLVFAVLYVFYPLILALLSALLNSSGPGVIAVGFGVSGSFFKMLFPIALILFLIIFSLLQRKRVKS
jgi:hypothetical protein